MNKMIGLIPARSGSLRVKSKNTRVLAGHPLIAYTIAVAQASGLFDRILVSTDCERTQRVARHYKADAPFLRPAEYASSTSPDIEWLQHCFKLLDVEYDAFAILRPTSPFRTVRTLRRAHDQFMSLDGVDSIRAVELVSEHPGKMWNVDQATHLMTPFLPQDEMKLPWHARQYQDMPQVYVQNSSLEMAWTRVFHETNSREGKVISAFLTEGLEGFSIDHPYEWIHAELLAAADPSVLPEIDQPPFADD